MASQAFERAMKKLETPSEALLADMIMRDITQLAEDAKDKGVTAYLRKPVHRKKPNERFLQGTLRSVAFANRKAEEDEMWVHRTKRARGETRTTQHAAGRSIDEGRSDAHSSESDSLESENEEKESEAGPSGAVSDSELADMLSRHRPRGRGAVGSRADEPGPFLPESALADAGPDDMSVRGPIGPERPAWLQRDAGTAATLKGGRSDSIQQEGPGKQVEKLHKVKKYSKGKLHKEKKKKKEKRHKEKKRRKKEKVA